MWVGPVDPSRVIMHPLGFYVDMATGQPVPMGTVGATGRIEMHMRSDQPHVVTEARSPAKREPVQAVAVPDGVKITSRPRAGDEHRLQHQEHLDQCYAAGYIDQDEHEARTTHVQKAVTRDELNVLTTDLPPLIRKRWNGTMTAASQHRPLDGLRRQWYLPYMLWLGGSGSLGIAGPELLMSAVAHPSPSRFALMVVMIVLALISGAICLTAWIDEADERKKRKH